jgi:hypothetical protein
MEKKMKAQNKLKKRQERKTAQDNSPVDRSVDPYASSDAESTIQDDPNVSEN